MNTNNLLDKMAIAAAGEFGKETAKRAIGWLDLIVRPPAPEAVLPITQELPRMGLLHDN